jgi:hypothetical protein
MESTVTTKKLFALADKGEVALGWLFENKRAPFPKYLSYMRSRFGMVSFARPMVHESMADLRQSDSLVAVGTNAVRVAGNWFATGLFGVSTAIYRGVQMPLVLATFLGTVVAGECVVLAVTPLYLAAGAIEGTRRIARIPGAAARSVAQAARAVRTKLAGLGAAARSISQVARAVRAKLAGLPLTSQKKSAPATATPSAETTPPAKQTRARARRVAAPARQRSTATPKPRRKTPSRAPQMTMPTAKQRGDGPSGPEA